MMAVDFGFLDRLPANRVASRNAIAKEYAKEQKRFNKLRPSQAGNQVNNEGADAAKLLWKICGPSLSRRRRHE